MTLLEGRVGGAGDGPEVTTLTARFHAGNGTSNLKQKMMDTTGNEESPFLLQQQQLQHHQQQRSGAYADSRTVTSPQRVPDMAQSSSAAVGGRCGRRQLQQQQQQLQQQQQQHELKGWSEVSNVLLQSTSDEAKDQRHSLANEAYNDRNNNNNSSNSNNPPQPGNQMNF